MSSDHRDRPDYDSFMIRLWHGATGERLLRAEIDHIQTGAVYIGRDIPADWIEQTVRASIRRRADIPEFVPCDHAPGEADCRGS